MFKKLNSKLGLTFLIVLVLLIVGIAYILYTSDSDEVKSARQNSEGRLVESDDVVVERAGNWTAQEAKSASSGSYLYSSGSPDDVLTLTFVGSRVEVIYTTGTNLGTLAVDVDRTVLRTVITADQATQYQERTVVDYLDDGLHTLRVYAQEGGTIGIDAFRISRPLTAELDATPINMAKIGDNVLESAITNGGASIIILLQEPTVHYSNEAVYKENIKQTQSDVLDSLAVGHFEVSHLYKTLPSFAGYADFNAILELQSNSLVKFIELDSSGGGSMGQSGPALNVDDVRNLYGIVGRNVVVAVLDTGMDTDHPDLSDAVIRQTCFNNGDCPPTNTDTGDSAEDEHGHGTEMTGIITSNGYISPISFAPLAKIVAVRVSNSANRFRTSDVIEGLDWVNNNFTNLSVDVVNMSLGTDTLYPGNCDTQQQNLAQAISRIHARGIKIFAATGNAGDPDQIAAPACITFVNAVGATYDTNYPTITSSCTEYNVGFNNITCFTNTSPELDLLAPGYRITSTDMNGLTVDNGGTSHATATTSGVATLVQETGRRIVNDTTFTNAITSGGTVLTRNGHSGTRIDALGAVQSVLLDNAVGAPANDLYTNAYQLPSISAADNPATIDTIEGEDYEYIQDTNGSTESPQDIPLPTTCGGSNFVNTVWYRYYDTSSYPLSLSTIYSAYEDNDPNTDTEYDTILAVYRSAITSGTLVICNDDINITNRQSALNLQVDAGFAYFIMVARKGNVRFTGPAGLHLQVSHAPAGDTLVTFDVTNSRIRTISSLRRLSQPVDTSFFPAFPIGTTPPTDNRRWVMGDWDGDGKKTPGFYGANGVFYTTNITGTVTDEGQAVWDGTWFGPMPGAPNVGVFAVAGRFDANYNNDCVGVIDSGNFPPYGVAFALYYTCDFSELNPDKTFQWLSVLLPDSQGFTGAFQFTTGDFGTDGNTLPNFVPDGIDTIAVRRGPFVAFTNTPPTTQNATYPNAQYLGFGNSGDYGWFVAGDWDTNGLDGFGIYFNLFGTLHYRNNLEWNNALNDTIQGVGTMGTGITYSAASWRETTPIWPTPTP